MVISSCTASPEAIAICGGSFGTKEALRSVAPVAGATAISAGLFIGGREVDRQNLEVTAVGAVTLVREPGQPTGALNPTAAMYGAYGISKEKLEALQDLLLLRYCAQSGNAQICAGLLWFGESQGFPYTIATDRPPISVNRFVTFPQGSSAYMIEYDPAVYPGYGPFYSDIPWELKNTQNGQRRWAEVGQSVRDAAVGLATPGEEFGTVERRGTVGNLSYPAGYDPASPVARANPPTVQISGTDRIFREPANIPGTQELEAGGPLINERGRDRRVGAGYPGGATSFQEGAGSSVGSRSGSITQSATGADGQTPAHNEKKIGFPLPGADGQLDSDDQISQEQSDPCQAPCIQDILNNVLDLVDLVTDIWELTSDYAVEDYLLPGGNFRFSIGDTGHPKDQIVAACIIQSGPVPQWYGRYFDGSLWVSTLYPKNLGSIQFTYQGIADRLIGFEGTAGLDLALGSPHTEVRSFNSLIFPSPDFPAKEVSFQARAGIDCRLRVLVRRYQLPI